MRIYTIDENIPPLIKMNLFYNIAISAYSIAVKAVASRNVKASKMIEGQSHTIATLRSKICSSDRYVWIHASSLGEFEQGRPLIEMIKRTHPELKILLTFFSPSGYEVRKNYGEADVVCYLPFDKPNLVEQFLDAAHPEMAIFVKYEFWGNYLNSLKRRNIPTYIISAIFREKQIFFKPWGGMFRNMLHCFTHIFVQDDSSKKLLAGIDVTNVTVAGDTRFDRVTDILAGSKSFPIVEKFVAGSEFTMIIGSSWEPDEDIVIPYFNEHPEMKLIIAPHEFDDTRLQNIIAHISRPTMLYSKATEDNVAGQDCLIIDCFGILSSCYRYADTAYIGGGFGAGIHNVNEAAVYGIPVIFGPNYKKFREAHELIDCEGGYTINGKDDFKAIADRLIADKEYLAKHGKIAGDYIHSHLGATKRIFDYIFGK